MLRLAQKAFYPGKIPFPLLHIDTTYKFREMIAFRDRTCQELGVDLIVHTNHGAIESGANPFHLGTAKCCGLLKTRALLDALQATELTGPLAVRAGRRKNRGPRSGYFLFATLRDNGTRKISAPSFGTFTTPA
jgi:3'-phosphoadenosine 5'-phosphosulfate sulfotransferase (PAPS reductase)/FAD synthetase